MINVTEAAPALTACCGRPFWRGLRCQGGCGHRQPVNGIVPVKTREQMRRDPLHAVQIAWTELRDRRQARRAGGKHRKASR